MGTKLERTQCRLASVALVTAGPNRDPGLISRHTKCFRMHSALTICTIAPLTVDDCCSRGTRDTWAFVTAVSEEVIVLFFYEVRERPSY